MKYFFIEESNVLSCWGGIKNKCGFMCFRVGGYSKQVVSGMGRGVRDTWFELIIIMMIIIIVSFCVTLSDNGGASARECDSPFGA